MSFFYDSCDPSSWLKELQQAADGVTESYKFSYSRNQDIDHNHIPSNVINAASDNYNFSSSWNLPFQWSNCSNVNGQVLEVHPLPTTSTEFNDQIRAHSTSSPWQMQPVTNNLVSPSSSKSSVYPMSANSKNHHANLTSTTMKTPICQNIALPENLLSQVDQNPSTNPTWPNCKPTSELEKWKMPVLCRCPNCRVRGGNQICSITGKLQHNCHECGKTFESPSVLRTHLIAHSDDRSFACTWYSGDKKFKTQKDILNHMKINTE